MRTNIEIDDKLLNAAMSIPGATTKKEVVDKTLKFWIQFNNQVRFKELKGKIKWEGDLDDMRIRK